MSLLSQFMMAGSAKMRFAEFTSSGTFTPTSGLIAQGGNCRVLLVGGGASGTTNSQWGGGRVLLQNLTITTPQTITIAAATSGDTFGNSSSIGGLLTATGGSTAFVSFQGKSGSQGFYGFGGVTNCGGTTSVNYNAIPNSGGACTHNASGSGYCLIVWYE